MRAVLCTEWGGPERLALRELPQPALIPGGVRIRVAAAAVNFADLLMIAGRYQENPPLPFSPGFEVAGHVTEVAPDAPDWRVGDRVMGMLPHGGYAEEVVLPNNQVFRVPDGLDLAAAAGFPVAFGTAYAALSLRARLRPGETLLVFGAAGGVGLAAVAIGRMLGATVIAVASGQDRLAITTEHGADHGIDHRRQDVADAVRAITGGRGVDVVLDPVGGPAFDAALRCVASEGRLVVVGFASGDVGQLSAGVALGKNMDLIGCYWGAYRGTDPRRVRSIYDELGRWVTAGRLRPRVAVQVPLHDAARALGLLRDRAVVGKIVLTMERPT